MFRTLRGRLTFSFVALAIGGIALVSLLINITVERRFEQYIRENMRERATRIARSLGGAYEAPRGWPPEFLMEITHWSLMEGLDITLEHPPGTVVWHSTEAAAGVNSPLPSGHPYPPGPAPDLSLVAPIISGGKEVAILRVTSDPQGIFTEHDLHFRTGLNRVLLFSALAAAVVALLAAGLILRGIHTPLLKMTRVAEKMRTGDWKQRVSGAGAAELWQLGEALNHLAVSLQSHEEMRQRMARDVAHELRTPLAVLRSHLEAIQDGIWEPTPERIRVCHDEVMRLVRLVDDLNELAEAESEALHLHCDDVSLRSLLDPLALGYEPLFAAKKVAFRYEPPPVDVPVWVDRDKAGQVIINLLANAQKYTPPEGQVTLAVTVDGEQVRIAVSDTGTGIPPEETTRIFERFYRGDPSRTRATGGSGLGLAIAQTLAEAHGGRIVVESRPGAGAVFTFILPRAGGAA